MTYFYQQARTHQRYSASEQVSRHWKYSSGVIDVARRNHCLRQFDNKNILQKLNTPYFLRSSQRDSKNFYNSFPETNVGIVPEMHADS